jgi:hypothetical protein
MVESSMARSYLQLCGRRECVTKGIIARFVPAPREHRQHADSALRLAPAIWYRRGNMVRLYGLLQILAALCCTNATSATPTATISAGAMQQANSDSGPSGSEVALPSDEAAISAFVTARDWLDSDQLPALDAPASKVALDANVEGIAVVLRIDGRVVGLGTAEVDPADRTSSRELLVRRAVGKAVARALGDDTVRAVRSALDDKVTARLSLEIELAGPSRPLLGRTIKDAAMRVVPGRDGLMLYRGQARFFAYPSHLLANDTALQPEFTLTALIREAGLPVKELNEYSTDQRVSLARFATVRLRQPDAASAPELLERGGRTIPLSDGTPARARALATQLCARLAAQVVSDDAKDAAQTPSSTARLLGSYNPTADEYQPPFATDRDAALAAFALARAARSTHIPAPIQAHARVQAIRLLDGLRTLDASLPKPGTIESKTLEPETIAMALLAAGELLKTTPKHVEDAGASAQSNVADLARLSYFRDQLSSWKISKDTQPSRAFPRRAQVTVACALLKTDALVPRVGNAAQPSIAALDARALLTSLFARMYTDAEKNPANLEADPSEIREEDTSVRATRASLVQAALPLSLLIEGLADDQADDVQDDLLGNLARFFEETRAAVARAQIIPDPSLDIAPDIEGGLPLAQGRGTRADTRCLLLAAALRIANERRTAPPVADADRVDAHESGPIVERRFLRFLAQHVAESPWCEGFRNPAALRGLVRASLATDDCPAAATPAGLLLAIGSVE